MVFSEFWEIFKTTYFVEHLRTGSSGLQFQNYDSNYGENKKKKEKENKLTKASQEGTLMG